MNGFEHLKAAVECDCNLAESCGCFNEQGCDKPRQSREGKRCFHAYCDKFKWAVDRAKEYGARLNLPWEDILTAWEEDRGYWYMNYYQPCNQPPIESKTVLVFDTQADLLAEIGKREFRCPHCGGISTDPYVCDSGLKVDRKVCDWKVYGLFGDLGKGVFVYVKEMLKGQQIFMPLSWEKKFSARDGGMHVSEKVAAT